MSSIPPLQHILLIDDSPDDRLLAMRQLSREFPDLRISEIVDFAQLKGAIAAADFELVVTDCSLGWTTGVDVLQAIKRAYPDCPVVMFTHTGTEEAAVEAMQSGLDEYVIESLHFVRLPQAVRTVWENLQARRQAERLQTRLARFLNQLDLGVFRVRPTGELVEVNAALLDIFGVPSLAAAQQTLPPVLQLKGHRWRDRRRVREQIFTLSTGQQRWLRISETLQEEAGSAIIEGLVEDISARKQAEQKIQHLNETLETRVRNRTAQLEAANQELSLLAYSISHDLRSPIRQVDGFIELLKDQLRESASDQTCAYLDTISHLVRQAGSMMDGILNLSRTGRVEMSLSEVDMDQLVSALRRQIDRDQTVPAIDWQIEPLPRVRCDRPLMQMVWQNLVENAVKFTRSRDHPQIWISGQQTDRESIYSIRDNGIGLDPKQSDRIFGLFQQAHPPAARFAGDGIGLAIVKRIISRHQGRIWVSSAVEQGATFSFALPLAPLASPPSVRPLEVSG